MKIIPQLVIFSLLFLSSYAATEPVMSLITVNTEDTAGYRDWAKRKLQLSQKPTALQQLVFARPRIGAEEMGDLYFGAFLTQTRQPGRLTLTTLQ